MFCIRFFTLDADSYLRMTPEKTLAKAEKENKDLYLQAPGIQPRTYTPIVAGSLWRLPASQRRVVPGRGNHRQRFVAASLARARYSVSKLVCHALRRSWAPLHGKLGSRLAGGSRKEM